MRKISAFLLVLGLALIAYSATLKPFTNENIFEQTYLKMSHGQSDEYRVLREKMLTPKYKLQDFGGTALLCSVLLFSFSRKGKLNICTPKHRRTLIILASVLPLITAVTYILDLLQAQQRKEFPFWADSLVIPLFGVPLLIALTLIWSTAHLSFLIGNYLPVQVINLKAPKKANYWLLLMAAISLFFTIESIAYGEYWYVFESSLWLYFYLSLSTNIANKAISLLGEHL